MASDALYNSENLCVVIVDDHDPCELESRIQLGRQAIVGVRPKKPNVTFVHLGVARKKP